MERGEEERGAFKTAVQEQVQRVLKELKVPVQSDVAELETRIAALERRVAELEGTSPQEDTLTDTRTD
ncbi:Poly(hydroxyalcanoate) granule associated protein (phasin) [compost metagenome]